MILALCTFLDYKVKHINMITAFLYSLLIEEIYMKLPHNYKEENYICHLNKTLYDLKQISHMWYETLQLFLESISFQTVQSDSAVFVSKNVIIAVYIDNLLLCKSDSHTLDQLKKHLQQHFKMTNLKQVSHYLDMKIDVSENFKSITIKQSTYIQNMLKHFNMQDCTPIFTLMNPSTFESLIINTEKATSEEISWY